ncbi:MAG: TIM44-like domain-containing protein [Halopseudomonas sp.]|uniref:Tim44 domain-containing protein n=1 Tax=Halopseudomonas sp. TaxID=2901191 RepID=UPI0030022469
MRWMLPFFAVMLMVVVSVPDAEARRMGGGKSFGSTPAHQSAPAQRQAPRDQAAPRQQPGAAATSGASRWLGPLAGIAAGGLLAAMLFGDGFEGIQLFDILLLGLIAFVLFKLFARRPQASPQPAGGPAMRETQAPIFGRQPTPTASASSSAAMDAPAWFDPEAFLRAAEEHFYTLQRHWRDGDTSAMAEYLDPSLLQVLIQARAEEPPAANGFVEQLQVRLDGVSQRNGSTLATVSFSGLDRDFPEDEGNWFDESWALERADGDNQPWIITGIRQNG